MLVLFKKQTSMRSSMYIYGLLPVAKYEAEIFPTSHGGAFRFIVILKGKFNISK